LIWENKAPVTTCDVWFFSIACEDNYLNILKLLVWAGIPLLSKDRDMSHPLLVGGGMAATYNPEPLAEFFDLFIIGESEGAIEPLLHIAEKKHSFRTKADMLEGIVSLDGVYIPRFYQVAQGYIPVPDLAVCPDKIRRNVFRSFEREETRSIFISSKNYKRKKIMAIEAARGCTNKCRFCVLSHVLRKNRFKSYETILKTVDAFVEQVDEIKLIFPSDLPIDMIGRMKNDITRFQGKLNVGSLRADRLDGDFLRFLAGQGKTEISIAPETGPSMRAVVNKTMKDDVFFRVIKEGLEAGCEQFCLFLMIGFPYERDTDHEELFCFLDSLASVAVETYAEINGKKAADMAPKIELNINPFFPKPHTPLQWADTPGWEETGSMLEKIRNRYSNHPMFTINSVIGSLEHFRQNLLCRGDRRLTDTLKQMAELTMAGEIESIELWKRIIENNGVDIGRITGKRVVEEALPWDFIDLGVDKRFLINEWKKAEEKLYSVHCSEGCEEPCGVCRPYTKGGADD